MTEKARPAMERLWNSNYLRVWGANFCLFFSFMLLTPLLPLYLTDTYGASKQEIGFVLSGYTLVALAVRSLSGYIVDSFPRKKVLLLSFFCFALFFAGYILAGTLAFFTIVRTLHGAPFGVATVSNSTVAIDVLPSSRRSEGIGYYGLSNNLATAISPTVALLIYQVWPDFDVLFALSLAVGMGAFVLNCGVKLKTRPLLKNLMPLSLDRFILTKGWSQGLCVVCFAFSYGVISTYIALYAKEHLGITGGTGLFFFLLALGLILSRLTGSRSLRRGLITRNATVGVLTALCGYLLFAAVHDPWAYYASALIIGLGNGHMFPAFQMMFINLASNNQRGAANSTLLVSWDVGIGLGILLGGVIADHFGFFPAFWAGWAVNGIGVILFLLYSRGYFLRHRLR